MLHTNGQKMLDDHYLKGLESFGLAVMHSLAQ